MSRARALATLASLSSLLSLAAGGGCTPGHGATSAPPAETAPGSMSSPQALLPIEVPAFPSTTEEFVQQQIQQRQSSLTTKMQDRGTPAAALASEYGELGKLLMAAQYHDAAAPCFLNAQALAPTDVRWPYYLGHLYKAGGALADSAAFFEQALRMLPDDLPSLIWLGDVYLQQGRPEAAEPLFAKALKVQPDSAAAHYGLGRAALARNDYRASVQQLEAALTIEPQAAAAHYPLGMAYRGLGDGQNAQAHLRQRRDIEPRPPDPLMRELADLVQSSAAYEARGARALDSGDWAEAARYFRKGLELAPAEPSLRHRLGTALFQMGDAGGAVEQFEQVARTSPHYAKAHYSLGLVMEASGRHREAIDRLSAAVREEPNYVEARVALADVLRRTGRAHESMPEYQHVLMADPRVADAAFGYAMALVALGRYEEARDRLAAGLKPYPNHSGFPHALARLLAAAPDDRIRDGRRAMALTQELLKLQTTLDLGETMAMTLAELGEYEQAAAFQRDVIAAAKQLGRDDLVGRMAENLALYEHRRPCRTPWRKGELP